MRLAALRAARRVIPLGKAVTLVNQGTFPQQPAGSIRCFPCRPWRNLLRNRSALLLYDPDGAGANDLIAAIGGEMQATLDARRLQNRHKQIDRCDRKSCFAENWTNSIWCVSFI